MLSTPLPQAATNSWSDAIKNLLLLLDVIFLEVGRSWSPGELDGLEKGLQKSELEQFINVLNCDSYVSISMTVSQAVITCQGETVELGLEGCHCLEQS